MTKNEPVMFKKIIFCGDATNEQKFFGNYLLWQTLLFMVITGSFLVIAVQKNNCSKEKNPVENKKQHSCYVKITTYE